MSSRRCRWLIFLMQRVFDIAFKRKYVIFIGWQCRKNLRSWFGQQGTAHWYHTVRSSLAVRRKCHIWTIFTATLGKCIIIMAKTLVIVAWNTYSCQGKRIEVVSTANANLLVTKTPSLPGVRAMRCYVRWILYRGSDNLLVAVLWVSTHFQGSRFFSPN